MSRSHSFSVEVAGVYTVDVALMLQHFCFWYEKVVSDGINKHKGEHWVRLKLKQMNVQFPYWGYSKIRHLVDKMIELDLIKKDEFNHMKSDRTKWYTLTNKSKKLLNISKVKQYKKATAEIGKWSSAEIDNPSAEIDNSKYKEVDIKDRYFYYSEKISSNKSLFEVIAMQNLIDIKTVENKVPEFLLHVKSLGKKYDSDKDLFGHFSSWIRKQDLKRFKLEKEVIWFVEMFNQVSGRQFKISDDIKNRFTKQFEIGFTSDQMRKSVSNLYSSAVANEFHIKSRYKFATPEYLLKEGNMNKYLNFRC